MRLESGENDLTLHAKANKINAKCHAMRASNSNPVHDNLVNIVLDRRLGLHKSS